MPTVIVYWSPGRTQDQKNATARAITDALVNEGGARREDVLIIYQDIQPGNAARGGSLIPPAVAGSRDESQDNGVDSAGHTGQESRKHA